MTAFVIKGGKSQSM